jgi:uncharacterized protein (TIGR00730 family)
MGVIKRVAIFGYAETKANEELFESARETAKVLAEAGYTIVNGGGPGVMRAATIGVHEGGGKAIGVTFYPQESMQFEGRDPENLIDEEIITPDYVQRTLKLMELGQIFMVFNGGLGTLSEFGMAWGLARLYLGHHKPLVLYGKFWETVVETIDDHLYLRPWDRSIITIVETPQEALRAVQTIDKQETEEKEKAKDEKEGEEGPFTL